jgi:tetratricopeptide (TPR) repeat protein
MDQLSLWCVTAVVAAVSLNTLWRICLERERFFKDDLSDADSAFAWQIVIFLVVPLLTLFDLRTTSVCCQWLGGTLTHINYAILWYQGIPTGLPSPQLFIPVLFSGTFAELALVLLLLPALAFRPHPFVAMLIGYTAAFVPAMNLIVEPILSALGLGNPKWILAMQYGAKEQLLPVAAVHALLAIIYLICLKSDWLRLWFSTLTHPNASDKLRETLANHENRDNAKTACYLALLYESAGLRGKAQKQLRRLKKTCPESLHTVFADAYLTYRRRDYKRSRKLFLQISDDGGLDHQLKGSFLAAAGCSCFAEGDMTAALNLCERALEFDNRSLVARMVKVDVFLRQGKKDQAGTELLSAMQLGLTQELENKIPLDVEQVFRSLSVCEDRRVAKEAIYAVTKS